MNIKMLLWLITLCLASFAVNAQPRGVKHYKDRAVAPDFTLTDSNEKTHKLSDYTGRVLIINFWATWCIPCRKEMPSLKQAWIKLQKKNIQLLGVATRDSKEAVMYYQKDNKIEFPLPIDKEGDVASNWAVMAVPTAYVIDPNGRVAIRVVGGHDWNDPRLIDAIIALKQKNKE